MRPTIQLLLIGLALVEIIGGHLVVMQGYAWARMIVSYSQTDGLSKGITKTFDGDHPCSICHAISDEREKEPEPGPMVPTWEQKLGQISSCMDEIVVSAATPYSERGSYGVSDERLRSQWLVKPEGPPPRRVAIVS